MEPKDEFIKLVVAKQKEIESRYKLGLAIFQLTEFIKEHQK